MIPDQVAILLLTGRCSRYPALNFLYRPFRVAKILLIVLLFNCQSLQLSFQTQNAAVYRALFSVKTLVGTTRCCGFNSSLGGLLLLISRNQFLPECFGGVELSNRGLNIGPRVFIL